MRGPRLLAFILAVAACSFAGVGSAADPVTLSDAERFDLRAASGRDYRVFVAVPKGRPPAAGWPVVYLTDGNHNFPLLRAAVHRLSAGRGPALVVGLGYPTDDAKETAERRTYDLTPATSAEWQRTFSPGSPAVRTGGRDELLAFLDGDLKREVAKRYAVDPARQTLFGHSLGGLFVLHALFDRPAAFQTYVASSPSVWWDDRSVLAEEKAFAAKWAGKAVPAKLLVTVGEWEEKPPAGTPAAVAGLLAKQRMVGHAKELSERLGKAGVKGLAVTFRELAEEDHASALLAAAGRGARLALDGG